MALRVKIPVPLQQFTHGQKEVELKGGTVSDTLKELVSKFPGMKKHIFDAQDRLSGFMNIYVNKEDTRYLPQERILKDTDEVLIIHAVSGG